MSSVEIAELTGKRHSDVLRDCRVMLDALGVDQRNFASIYRDAHDREQPCLSLPKDMTLTLVSGYDVRLRKRIIDRWLELEVGRRPEPARTIAGSAKEIAQVFSSTSRIAKLAGLKGNPAILSAAMATKKLTGTDPLELVGRTHLPAPTNVQMVNPTTIGQQLGGMTAQAVNKLLFNEGFQTSFRSNDRHVHWTPTSRGEAAGARMMDTGKQQGGRMIQQLMWPASIVETLRSLIEGRAVA